jgi:tetratricopeptide (TPR) repeat protein
MAEPLFVDRVAEIARLETFRNKVHTGAGGLMLLKGPAGIGKSALMAALRERASSNRTAGLGSSTRFIEVLCHPHVGQENAYGPFLDLFIQVHGTRARRWLRAAGDAAPTLLEGIPGASPLKAGAVAVQSAMSSAPGQGSSLHARTISQRVLATLKRRGPVILIVEDAHQLDASSCAVISCLRQTIAQRPIGIVLVCRIEELARNDAASDLVSKLYSSGELDHIRLPGLPKPAIAEYVAVRTGVDPSPPEVDELARRTGGQPFILHHHFSGLQVPKSLAPATGGDASGGRHPDLLGRVPSQIGIVIQARLRGLDPDEHLLLKIAAVQGEWFLSAVVADVSGRPDVEVLTTLHRIASETALISELSSLPWIEAINSDAYAFEHALLQEVLYDNQSGQERRSRHRAVAAALQRLFTAAEGAPREFLLEILRHHHVGGNHMEAAQQGLEIARRLAAEGSSPVEVTTICQQAMGDLHRAGANGASDRLRAELIELLLTASELRWRGRMGSTTASELEGLSEEALAAAKRTGDAALQSRMAYLHGRVLLHTQGVPPALKLLREARELAMTTGDAPSIFLTSAEYGRQLPKVDVAAGLQVLHQAEELVRSHPALRTSTDPVIQRARDLNALQLGVNLLDAGNLGEALSRLRRAIARIRPHGGFGILPIGLNYLGQALQAAGHFDDAESVFREAVDLVEEGDEAAQAWHATNLAYLGHLVVIRRAELDGIGMIEAAWAETERTWLANLVPVVRNLHGAALLHLARTEPKFHREARPVLRSALTESRRSGMLRSEVAALSLLAQLELAQGRSRAALELSGQALTKLQEASWRLPTVSAEEVLYRHAIVQQACGNQEEAEAALDQAWDEVQAKARTLPKTEDQRRFLDVPINQLIRQAVSPTT